MNWLSSPNYTAHWDEVEKRHQAAQDLKERTWGDVEHQRPQMRNDTHSKALAKSSQGYFNDDALLREHRGEVRSFGAYQVVDASRK